LGLVFPSPLSFICCFFAHNRVPLVSTIDMDNHPPPIDDPDSLHHELMHFLSGNREMRKTAHNAIKHGIWAGSGAITGAMVGGPLGGALGGVAGSIIGYFHADEYDGVVKQLRNLDESHRQRLLRQVGGVLMSAGASNEAFTSSQDFREALSEFAEEGCVRDGLWRVCAEAVQLTR